MLSRFWIVINFSLLKILSKIQMHVHVNKTTHLHATIFLVGPKKGSLYSKSCQTHNLKAYM